MGVMHRIFWGGSLERITLGCTPLAQLLSVIVVVLMNFRECRTISDLTIAFVGSSSTHGSRLQGKVPLSQQVFPTRRGL